MSTPKLYLRVTILLMVLLFATVGAAFVDLGPMNTAVAMSISLVKAALIVLFFMHVRHATPIVKLFVCAGFFWLGILLTLTLSDFLTR